MTGADQIDLSTRAVNWARADRKRMEMREAWKARSISYPTYISAARSAGNYRRGLLAAAAAVLARGLD